MIGRERELAAIEEALDREGLRAVTIEGEPGIGKTTLWQGALGRIRTETTLVCRAVEAEAKLGYAALTDLVAPVIDEQLPGLPEPQRAALEVALLRASPPRRAPERRAVATAVHSLLRRCEGLVVAIDDVQWLDAASAAVLSFALRRLDAAVLLTRRAGAADPLELPARGERILLGPLSLSALHHVIKSELDHVFPRPTLQRIAQASGGNPLFAVELARALARTGAHPGPGEPLPVPETLPALITTRLERLPRETLLACATLSAPTVELAGDVTAAVDAGVLHVDGDGRISFAHPLIASTVYSSATAGERRAMHERLAAVVRDPEQRVRHLALAVDGPDERVAAELEAAAAQATTHVAVELAQLAYDLTPQDEPEARTRRALALAEDVFRAGDTVEARTIVERVVDERPAGPLRARALELLARILFVAGTASEAYAAAERALAEAGDAVELRARVHATASRVSYHDFELGRRHSARALELLDRLEAPDPVLLQEVLTSRVDALIHANDALPHDLIDRALQLEEVAPVPDVADRMSAALGAWLKLFGDFDGARQWLERTHRAALDEGDDASLPYALSHLPQLELWSGNWAESERCALEHLDLAEEMAQPDQRRQALYNLAAVHAHLGRVDDARAEAETLLADARAAADTWGESNAEAVLGLLELSRGDSAAAVGHLERNFELREALAGSEAPRAFVDLVEALVAEGDIERGDAVARVVSERARRQPLRVVAAYGRGLVAAARGDLDAAAAAFDESLEHVVVPFDRARTLLAYGLVRRRRGERRAAKETLEEARTIFEELGAELWAERAAAELRRIPIRRAAGDELTPTEERVAELAAAGRTNREMAQALFMSPKSVEANLTRIYRKLGIGSRAELGATMAERAKA